MKKRMLSLTLVLLLCLTLFSGCTAASDPGYTYKVAKVTAINGNDLTLEECSYNGSATDVNTKYLHAVPADFSGTGTTFQLTLSEKFYLFKALDTGLTTTDSTILAVGSLVTIQYDGDAIRCVIVAKSAE